MSKTRNVFSHRNLRLLHKCWCSSFIVLPKLATNSYWNSCRKLDYRCSSSHVVVPDRLVRFCEFGIKGECVRQLSLVPKMVAFGGQGNRHFHSSCCRLKRKPVYIEGGDSLGDEFGNDDTEEEVLLRDVEHQRMLREYCSIPGMGHRVLVLQPDFKGNPNSIRPSLTTPELQLSEACALVETLTNWKVVQKMIVPVHNVLLDEVFSPGRLSQLTENIRHNKHISAVFLSSNRLAVSQISLLQTLWDIPILDRFTVVLQIFKEHARTREAKIQVALAEIPLIKHRLSYIHPGSHDNTCGGGDFLRSDAYIQNKWSMLGRREQKLRTMLKKIKAQREFLRKGRRKRQQPTVAVVGYTNCGKTTLIKALTGDRDMEPKDQLFATLDVTSHGGTLPNHLSILYMDTVGFIADIPISLIDAFSATLEDAMIADVIIHLQDASHPDRSAQKENVQGTLRKMLTDGQYNKIICVGNKVDLVKGDELDPDCMSVSSVTGSGLMELQQAIEKALLLNTGLLEKKVSIPAQGTHLRWLYRYATVKSLEAGVKPDHLLVDIVISSVAYARFKATYGKPTTKTVDLLS